MPPHLRLITRHALLTYAHKHWASWQFHLLGQVVRLEAWFRQWQARRAGDDATAHTFATSEVSTLPLATRFASSLTAMRWIGAVCAGIESSSVWSASDHIDRVPLLVPATRYEPSALKARHEGESKA